MGLHIGSTLDHVLGGGVASLVEDSPHKALSSPEVSKALASALMRVLSEGIEHTTGLFCRLQANCVFFVWFLAGRDAVLAFFYASRAGPCQS